MTWKVYNHKHTWLIFKAELKNVNFSGNTLIASDYNQGNYLLGLGDTGDVGSVNGWGRSPGVGNGNLLQYSCLKNPMERGAW